MVNDLAIHPLIGMLFGSSEGPFTFKDNLIKNIFVGTYDQVFVDHSGLIWTYSRTNGLTIYDAEFKTIHTEITDQIESLKHISNSSDNIICLVADDTLFEVSKNKVATFETKNISISINSNITLSIGIGLFTDSNWENAQSHELIKQTDQGLYLAQKNGKNQYTTTVEDTHQ